jgi:gliding motility-associated-like protein
MKNIKNYLFFFLILALAQGVAGQAPKISYSRKTYALTPGTAFSISPANSGGTVSGSQYYKVSTFAGSNSGLSGTAGYVNATGTAALFNNPLDMAFDASDNLYVCDAGNNAIRKITPAGVVTTFAGSPTGAAGVANGTGTSALFNFPDGLIFDNFGNLYVSDLNNYAIREITPAGVVSTYYQGNSVYFNPTAMCFDAYNNLLVILQTSTSPTGTNIYSIPGINGNISLISPGYMNSNYNNFFTDVKINASQNEFIADIGMNEIETQHTYAPIPVAGNYTATSFSLTGVGQKATFTQPRSVQPMADGTVYVTDQKNNDIRKITPDTVVSVLAGYVPLNGSGYPTQQPGYVDGAIANAQFNQPAYIRADSKGNLYVSEWGAGGNRIRKIALGGFFFSGPALPGGLVFDPQTGGITGTPLKKITVAQTDTVTAINASGSSITTITFTPGPTVVAPHISYASNNITTTPGVALTQTPKNTGGPVPATAYATVSSFVGSPTQTVGYVNLSDTAARFSTPQEMVMDAVGNLYVADSYNAAIRKITPAGAVTTFAGSITGFTGFANGTGTNASFNFPDGLAIDSAGNLYVADYNNNAIRKITPGQVVTTFYSTTSTFGPGGMCFDKSGNLLVSAQDANQLLKITPSGVASVLSGSTQGYVNGSLASAKFFYPSDVKVDTSGNIYVADFRNNVIRKITPSGTVSLLAGDTSSKYAGYANSGLTQGFANGKGPAAIFNNPSGIVVAPGGVIYAADLYNNDLRRIMPDGTVGLVAGSATQAMGDANGIGTAAGLSTPAYIYMDDAGNGYIAEFAAERIRKIVLTGYSISDPLPAGLTFNPVTGTISGTPASISKPVKDTVTAYNAGGYSSTVITLGTAPNNSLTGLAISTGTLKPAFNTATTTYAVSEPNTVTSIQFTSTTSDNTAVVTINGAVVASGALSPAIPLSVGSNPISVTVVDNSGTTATYYTVSVTRAPSANAKLVNLTTNAGALSPVFKTTTTSYTESVGINTTSITFTPTTADTTATVTVNGTAVASGTASAAISLNVGANVINTVVTAQNGTTQITYTVTVTRAASTNAELSKLATSRGGLTPEFAPATTSYTKPVGSGITSITFTPTTADPNATVTVDGATTASGTASASLPLSVGNNPETITVTAQDGVTTLTYTVTVTRAAGLTINNIHQPPGTTDNVENPAVDEDGLAVREALTPNGDGINDFLVIDGISAYPDNNLTIANSSGQLVFQSKGYDNQTHVFDGHSNKNGQMQSPGTYFYILDYTADGVAKHKSGYIVLKY